MSHLWSRRTLWIAAVYFILGYPALYFADSSGYAVPVWPAAGWAVGVVYCYKYGYRACWGIALGSMVLNYTVPVDGGVALWAKLSAAPLIGIGAAAQAAVARALLISALGPSSGLKTLRSGLLFCLIAGPAACLVNGFWGPFVLRFTGIANGVSWLDHVRIWWVGDTIGAMLFAPATLAFLSRDEPDWKDRTSVLYVPGILSIAFTAAIFFFGRFTAEQFYNVALNALVIFTFVNLALLKASAYYLLEDSEDVRSGAWSNHP